jgi:hypothetical protein
MLVTFSPLRRLRQPVKFLVIGFAAAFSRGDGPRQRQCSSVSPSSLRYQLWLELQLAF